ncbi:serine hydrolase domain-containing protein [Streptomyces erythrochromogenes]|uniref:serine hydrolase domain-containing protein n=1 Tax=Streptomyces erythrochromogenes TaxID=285574 RepID=UPI0033C466C8
MTADSQDAPGLALLVRRPGQQPACWHAGLANVEHQVRIGADTAFNTGSVAKQITAHLVLLAARDSLIHLHQPAADLLPKLRVTDVTVADLITHTSGVRDAESLLSLAGLRDLDHYTAADLRTLAYRQHERAVPKGQFLYSNTNYLLLAELLEVVHRTDLPDLARRRIFDPLGMQATHFQADTRQVIRGAAAAYRPARDGWRHTQPPVALPGPGALFTTTGDLDLWLGHLHQLWQYDDNPLPRGDLLGYKTADRQPYLYGPGLYADPRPGHTSVFHYGHEHGFSAATHLTRGGLRIVCLANSTGIAADHALAAVLRALDEDHDRDDLEGVMSLAARRAQRSDLPVADGCAADGGAQRELGRFTCDEVPGVLRLTSTGDAFHLWRRGTPDRLAPVGPGMWAGNGYSLTLPGGTDDIKGFTLDLDRAPRLIYKRLPAS